MSVCCLAASVLYIVGPLPHPTASGHLTGLGQWNESRNEIQSSEAKLQEPLGHSAIVLVPSTTRQKQDLLPYLD
jgi:hypothetical protein